MPNAPKDKVTPQVCSQSTAPLAVGIKTGKKAISHMACLSDRIRAYPAIAHIIRATDRFNDAVREPIRCRYYLLFIFVTDPHFDGLFCYGRFCISVKSRSVG